jgi:hypothetical protein
VVQMHPCAKSRNLSRSQRCHRRSVDLASGWRAVVRICRCDLQMTPTLGCRTGGDQGALCAPLLRLTGHITHAAAAAAAVASAATATLRVRPGCKQRTRGLRERGSINTHHTDSRRRTGSSRVVTLSPASSRSLSGNDEDVSSAQSSSGVSMAHVQSSLPPSLSQQHKKDGEPLAELSRPHGPPESPVSIQQQQQQQQQQLLQPPEIRPLELEHVHGRHPAPSASIPSSRRHPAVEWLERGGAVFGLRQGGPAVECPVMLRW